jgi:DNA polymerase III subunit delta'
MFEDLIEVEHETTDEGLLPPRQTVICVGHENVEKKLIDMITFGHFPHALIFAGSEGIGKATMAFRLARYLLRNGVAGIEGNGDSLFGGELPPVAVDSLDIAPDDRVFSQVASGGHPDLRTHERLFDEKKNRIKAGIEVNQAREVAPFLSMTAAKAGGWRIVIIDDADTMNRNAQNALLKTLEEPPSNTVLVLVAHRAGALISTIRSRCRVINFQPLTKEVFSSLLKQANPEITQKEMDILYDISGGSIGQAIRIIDEGGLPMVDKVISLFQDWPNWNWPEIHNLANKLGRKGQDTAYRAFTDVMKWLAVSLTRTKARGEKPCEVLAQSRLLNVREDYTLEEWNKICEKLNEHFDMVMHSSLDKHHGVLGAFSIFGGN